MVRRASAATWWVAASSLEEAPPRRWGGCGRITALAEVSSAISTTLRIPGPRWPRPPPAACRPGACPAVQAQQEDQFPPLAGKSLQQIGPARSSELRMVSWDVAMRAFRLSRNQGQQDGRALPDASTFSRSSTGRSARGDRRSIRAWAMGLVSRRGWRSTAAAPGPRGPQALQPRLQKPPAHLLPVSVVYAHGGPPLAETPRFGPDCWNILLYHRPSSITSGIPICK